MKKKYWYNIWAAAECSRNGWIYLTEEEADIFNRISNTKLENEHDDGYSGTFGISLDSKTDSEEPPAMVWD